MTKKVSLGSLEESTRAGVFDGEPKMVRLLLEEGQEIPPHDHPEANIVLLGLEGETEVSFDGESFGLEVEEVLGFDGANEVSLEGKEERNRVLIYLAEK